MPHTKVDKNLPGIRSLMAFSPETATPMGELANSLLRTNEGLSMADRELIAAHVSYLNDCFYCQQSHGAIAVCYLEGNTQPALITETLKQRRYSLFSERHRWIDLRRYNLLNTLPLDRPGDDVWTEFPLPVTEQ